jgi:hypothetical protein
MEAANFNLIKEYPAVKKCVIVTVRSIQTNQIESPVVHATHDSEGNALAAPVWNMQPSIIVMIRI